MAIKTTPSTQIPFLQQYIPYTIPLNAVVVDDINNMISYDLQPNKNTTINYSIGTDKVYETIMNIKNITTNCKIKVNVSFNNNIFVIDRNNFTKNNTSPLIFELQPSQVEQLLIRVKNETLDTKISYQPEQTQIKLVVENIIQTEPILRNVSTEMFSKQSLPETITLD